MALTSRLLGGFLDRFKTKNCIISCEEDLKNNVKAQTIIISSTSDLSTSLTNSVTNYQIENGTNISDHTHPQPPVLALNVIISNDDFDYTKPQNLFADTGEDVKTALEEFATKGVKLEIRYRDNVYTDYIITSLSLSKNSEVGDNYTGSISLQKIYLAQAQVGTIKKGKQPVQAKAKKKSILAGLFK
jgi:hypothetical protein